MILMAKNNPGRNGINFGSRIEISINKVAELVIKNVAIKEMNVLATSYRGTPTLCRYFKVTTIP
jgi:hypothetical protein